MQDLEWVKEVFNNLRNLVVCALLIAAGLFEREHPSGAAAWIGFNLGVGWGMVAIGAALALLNLVSGLAQLSRLSFPRMSMALLCVVYVAISLRLITVLTGFRSV